MPKVLQLLSVQYHFLHLAATKVQLSGKVTQLVCTCSRCMLSYPEAHRFQASCCKQEHLQLLQLQRHQESNLHQQTYVGAKPASRISNAAGTPSLSTHMPLRRMPPCIQLPWSAPASWSICWAFKLPLKLTNFVCGAGTSPLRMSSKCSKLGAEGVAMSLARFYYVLLSVLG